MRVSWLHLVNMLTLRKSEVIIVLDMFKLVELRLGLLGYPVSSQMHYFPCVARIWKSVVIDIC